VNVYARAAQYLKSHGWTKGRLEDVNGRVCAWGAIQRVEDNLHERDEISYVLDKIAQRRAGSRYISVSMYNDEYAKSVDDIISLFEEASVE
jgi:hypothetical protein